MNLNLKQLETFVCVADLGSFRAAAQKLNTTQPNVSGRVAALETALNVRLMERDAGSVRLTSVGRELLEHARRVLRSAEAFIDASGRAVLHDGLLKLGVTEMVALTWLREYLRRLKQHFPNLNVELSVDLSARLEEELFSRSIDLAIHNAPFTREATGNVELGSYPLAWYAAPALELDACNAVTMAQLTEHPILTHARDTRPFEQVTVHFAQRRDLSARFVPSSSLAACAHMTMDGMGIATLPSAMVAEDVAAERLRPIAYAWTPDPLHFVARYDAHKAPSFVATAAAVAEQTARAFRSKVAR